MFKGVWVGGKYRIEGVHCNMWRVVRGECRGVAVAGGRGECSLMHKGVWVGGKYRIEGVHCNTGKCRGGRFEGNIAEWRVSSLNVLGAEDGMEGVSRGESR